MRTTVSLDDDVVAAVEALRRDRAIGLSVAINELARAGAAAVASARAEPVFRQRSSRLGARVDLDDVGGVLALLDDDRLP